MNEYDIYEQLSGMYENIKKGTDNAVLKDLFAFLKKFPKVAPFNLALVTTQRPGAGYFANRKEWAKLGRSVKPEARPMIILHPFGPVDFVYDVSDTFGRELPQEVENPFLINTPFVETEYMKFVNQLSRAGVKYATANYGSQMGGKLTRLEHSERMRLSPTKEIEILFQITVNSNLSPAEKFATIAHELGHLFCGHLGAIDDKSWPNRWNLSRNQWEFEAESVCWLVCERRGIKNPSENYLRGYLDFGGEIPKIDVGAILRAVTYIESMLHGHFQPLRSLVIEQKKKVG